MKRKQILLKVFGAAGICLLLALAGCTSKPSSKLKIAKSSNRSAPNTDASEHYFDGGTYCVQTFIQGPAPAQPLRFSAKVTESDQSLKSKDWQADLAGDTLDIVQHDRWLATDDDRKFFEETRKYDDPKIVVHDIRDGYAEETVTNHVARSDESGWRMAGTGFTQGATPWSLFLNKPPVTRVGSENINGYETNKYSVDTTRQTQSDKSAFLMFSGATDYNITGTAWVLKNPGCVLQYDLEFDQVGKDGKLSKTHFEGTITKKEATHTEDNSGKTTS